MTYAALREIKVPSMTLNCIIDDAINNAIFCFGRKRWQKQNVSAYEISQIREWAIREGVIIEWDIEEAHAA